MRTLTPKAPDNGATGGWPSRLSGAGEASHCEERREAADEVEPSHAERPAQERRRVNGSWRMTVGQMTDRNPGTEGNQPSDAEAEANLIGRKMYDAREIQDTSCHIDAVADRVDQRCHSQH